MIKTKHIFCLSLLLILGACSSGGGQKAFDLSYQENLLQAVDMSKYDDIIHSTADALIESAQKVNHSLERLAQIESAAHPGLKLPSGPDARKIGMSRLINLDWVGPVEPVMGKIAEATRYKLRMLGSKPAVPILVDLHIKRQSVADVVRNIKFQVLHHAQVEVYPKERVIELRYNQG
jgi:defect in organelle trafficking protein DotD